MELFKREVQVQRTFAVKKSTGVSQRTISEFIGIVSQSVEDEGQESNNSALDLPAEPVRGTRSGSKPPHLEDFRNKP